MLGVVITTVGWITVTLLTPHTARATLQSFYERVYPHPAGWRAAVDTTTGEGHTDLAAAVAGWFPGALFVYAALFGTGYLLYGQLGAGSAALAIAAAAGVLLMRVVARTGIVR